MKVLIVNTLDIQGGAARVAERLHRALFRCWKWKNDCTR